MRRFDTTKVGYNVSRVHLYTAVPTDRVAIYWTFAFVTHPVASLALVTRSAHGSRWVHLNSLGSMEMTVSAVNTALYHGLQTVQRSDIHPAWILDRGATTDADFHRMVNEWRVLEDDIAELVGDNHHRIPLGWCSVSSSSGGGGGLSHLARTPLEWLDKAALNLMIPTPIEVFLG